MPRRTTLALCAVALALAPSAAFAGVSLDTGFGGDGTISVSSAGFTGGTPEVSGILRLGTGEIMVAGYDTGGAPAMSSLMQIDETGIPDSAFGTSGVISFDLGASALATSFDRYLGIILLSGSYDDGAGGAGGFVAKYDGDGLPYTDFSGDGFALDAEADVSYGAVVVDDGNGALVFGYDSGDGTSFVKRYGADGVADTGFGTGGVVDLGAGRVYAADIDADGRVIAVGNRIAFQQVKVWALSQAGVLDSTFGTDGVVAIDYAADSDPVARALAFSPSGQIAIGGSYGMTESPVRRGFVRLLQAGGETEASFGVSGLVITGGTDDEVTSLTYAEDGTLFASGELGGLGGAVYAYDESGSLDVRFSDDGAFDPGVTAGGASLVHYDDGVLSQAFANVGRSLVVVARYAVSVDVDGDGVYDLDDNCPDDANAGQADIDEDGAGDACDPTNDLDDDGDSVVDVDDNCPDDANPGQADADEDGIGDACDVAEEESPRRGGGRRHRVAAMPEADVPATSTAAVAFSRDLFVGDSGDDVAALQELLIARAAGPAAAALGRVGATGYFGEYTRAAVAELQRALGVVPAAGYFGPLSRAALGA